MAQIWHLWCHPVPALPARQLSVGTHLLEQLHSLQIISNSNLEPPSLRIRHHLSTYFDGWLRDWTCVSDSIDLLWLGFPGKPGGGHQCGQSSLGRPVRSGGTEVGIDSRTVCMWVCGRVGGVNLPELGQMLLTSSSQVGSLRGKMASNPPGVRAFGLTHWEPSLSAAPSSQSPSPFTHTTHSFTDNTHQRH